MEGQKWSRVFVFMKNMAWLPVRAVTDKDIFKIPNDNVVQSVEALGSLERNQNRIRIFALGTNN